jgi:uncharacterized membrane protein YoaT (DUF817 family)
MAAPSTILTTSTDWAALWGKRFAVFATNEALSSVFALSVFAWLALSKFVHVPGLPRYDLILLLCVAVQIALVKVGWETWDELKVICCFHVLGLALEMFKVQHGAWAYPEPAYLKFRGVPLYSGFMYASVGSYLCQAWRRFSLRLLRPPSLSAAMPAAFAIYINFFTELILPDIRWLLLGVVLLVYWRTKVSFKVYDRRFRMPMVQSFLLIGFFIWIAENICTRLGAWRYPYQANGWTLVHGSKIGSWCLLVILSFVLVAALKEIKEKRGDPAISEC